MLKLQGFVRGSYRVFFVMRDYLILFFRESWIQVNFSFMFRDQLVVRAPRKTRIIICIRHIVSYFSLIFSFETSGG